MTTPISSGRRGWMALLIGGAVLMFIAGLLVVTSRNILDSERFGANLASSLGDDRVAAYVAEHVTDAIIAKKPDLVPIRPILLGSVRSIVASEPFRAVVRTSARSAHRFFFEQAGSRVVLSLPDIGTVVRSALSQASPELAAKIPPGIEAQLATGQAEKAINTFIRLWRFGDRLLTVAWIAWYVGVVLIVAGIALAPDKRRGLADAGIALLTIGVIYLAIVPASRLVLMAAIRDGGTAGFVHGMVVAFLGRLRLLALVIGLPGLLLLAAGTASLEKVDALDLVRQLGRLLVTPPEGKGWRLLWAACLLLLGTAAVVWPGTLIAGVVIVLGVALLHGGLRELFRLVIGQLPSGVLAGAQLEGTRWPIVAGAFVVVLGLGGVGAWLLKSGRGQAPPPAATSLCNGFAALCDKTVDEVVFPMAHNAMSNVGADHADWMFPHHTRTVVEMLEDGVRGLALDIHYGIPTGGRVKTDIDHEVASRDKIAGALGAEGVAAAMRIRDRLVGGENGRQGIYFCHGFCELGAYPVAPTFSAMKDWLVANPGEVVVLVLEDYIKPQEMDSLFKATGLFDFVYTGSMTNFPTLRELIDNGQRLIVFIESGNTGVAYLHPTLPTIAETPYTFHKPEEFSCRPNRGQPSNVLFMINHWIETTPAPRPSNATIVNAYDFLLRRARQCQRERNHLPNMISVDFASVGDLLRVANTLNGVDSTAATTRTRPN